MFEKVKKFYDLKIYNVAQVMMFVNKGKITEEQALEIIGEK